MKHIKKFNEHYFQDRYDFGRFGNDEEVEDPNFVEQDFTKSDSEEGEFANELELEDDEIYVDEEQEDEEENGNRIRRWGDEEVVEKKKVNPGFQAYLDKQKGKKTDKVDDKKGGKKSKPDFLDLNKDGDKKEPMKKAAKDVKEDEKEVKGAKGLTAKQKKLPAALQASILKKQK
jgi:hypothetical protein